MTLRAVALLLLLPASALAAPALAEGALATGPRQAFGFGYNYAAPRDARMRALEECGGGCSVVTLFRGACVAHAADRTRGSAVVGWAEAPEASAAERGALASCKRSGGRDCRATVHCDE